MRSSSLWVVVGVQVFCLEIIVFPLTNCHFAVATCSHVLQGLAAGKGGVAECHHRHRGLQEARTQPVSLCS